MDITILLQVRWLFYCHTVYFQPFLAEKNFIQNIFFFTLKIYRFYTNKRIFLEISVFVL